MVWHEQLKRSLQGHEKTRETKMRAIEEVEAFQQKRYSFNVIEQQAFGTVPEDQEEVSD